MTQFVLLAALSVLLPGTVWAAPGPATTANDDSCDISVAPAATLLLPYFEVDLDSNTSETALFTITNVAETAQVARVTLWTDYAYPVVTFNLYLSGYDVQSINLFDVLARGVIGATGNLVSPEGEQSNPNPLLDLTGCGSLPTSIAEPLLAQARLAFIEGIVPGCTNVGDVHENAVGYATIDVVGTCSERGPLDPKYFSVDLRYDNVLVGEYMQVSSDDNFAQGNPMVHIRAVPEGGSAQSRASADNRLSRTFYGRLQDPARANADARQPLPSSFAMHWYAATGHSTTELKIWRERLTGPVTSCAENDNNGSILVLETIAFDDDENGEGVASWEPSGVPNIEQDLYLPATSRIRAGDINFFRQGIFSYEDSGWLYLNLDDRAQEDGFGAHQNWVVVSMRAEGRYSVDFDAAYLGNGCSPAAPITAYSDGNLTYLPGPAADIVP
jgi:hypothetical protein